MPKNYPDRSFEDSLFSNGYEWVIGVDEVGRGCISGPVGIGVTAMKQDTPAWPEGLRDSKLVPEKRRAPLRDAVVLWVHYYNVAFSTADEILKDGINPAQASAGERALKNIVERIEVQEKITLTPENAIIILDGSSNWLAKSRIPFKIIMKTKADRDCVIVAAASILAKVERDEYMIKLDTIYPGYGFAGHKGYGSAEHYASIRRLGMIKGIHRESWIKL